MHDPDTLIASLGPLTLWHHDPECDGTDSSCDHRWERMTKRQRSNLEFALSSPCDKTELLFSTRAKYPDVVTGMISAECLAELVHGILGNPVKSPKWSDVRHEIASNSWRSMAFLPGYHSNGDDDSPDCLEFKRHRMDVASGMAYQILVPLRPWLSSNKFHFWHYRIHCREFWKKTDPADCCKDAC